MIPHRPPQESDDSPSFDLAVAAALWIGAVCIVCAVSYGAAMDEGGQVNVVILVLDHYYGKWLVAVLATIVSLGMTISAIRRMRNAPKEPEFLEGALVLESVRWLRQPPKPTRRNTPR